MLHARRVRRVTRDGQTANGKKEGKKRRHVRETPLSICRFLPFPSFLSPPAAAEGKKGIPQVAHLRYISTLHSCVVMHLDI